MRAIFERDYVAQYGLKLDDMAIELVNWHVTARGRLPDRAAAHVVRGTARPAPRSRIVHLRGKPVETAVYARTELLEGDAIPGPVIVEERETTIFVLPGWTIRLHPNGSLVADKITEQ